MKPPRILAMLALAGPFLIPATQALAQWSASSTVNTPVNTSLTDQVNVNFVSDAMGGAYIGWVDFDPATGEYDIRAQRISAAGTIQWGPTGIPVCALPAKQTQLRMCSDGAGGAVLAWMDDRSNNINTLYVQHLDANGASLWASGGVPVCPSTTQQVIGAIVPDGAGGAIVTWQDYRTPGVNAPYAQRLDANGAPMWAQGGVLLASGPSEFIQPVADGAGGAFVTWHHYVSGWFDIVAQRVESDGSLAWGNDGITVCNAVRDQKSPRPILDGAGGVIIAWEDYRNTTYSKVYAQRLDGAGVAQWAVNGVNTADNTLDARLPRLLSDGSGGAYIVWSYVTGYGIYAQRIGSAGAPQWGTEGTRIAQRGGHVWDPAIVTDGAGGAIISWCDDRPVSFTFDVFAQRVNPAGVTQWTTDGVGVCTQTASQISNLLLADGYGGALVLWRDARNQGTNELDLYAQRIDPTGNLGPLVGVDDRPGTTGGVMLAQNHPNPCRNATTIEWRMPERAAVSLDVFDVSGRQVATLASEVLDPGVHTRELETSGLAGGVYYYHLRVGSFALSRRMLVVR